MSAKSFADDPQLEEFLKVMQPRSKSAIWANDDSIPEAAQVARGQKAGRRAAENPGKSSDTDEEDDAEFQDLAGAGLGEELGKGKPGRSFPASTTGTAPPLWVILVIDCAVQQIVHKQVLALNEIF